MITPRIGPTPSATPRGRGSGVCRPSSTSSTPREFETPRSYNVGVSRLKERLGHAMGTADKDARLRRLEHTFTESRYFTKDIFGPISARATNEAQRLRLQEAQLSLVSPRSLGLVASEPESLKQSEMQQTQVVGIADTPPQYGDLAAVQADEEIRAALKIQSLRRGQDARRDVQEKREQLREQEAQVAAATKIQSMRRGKEARGHVEQLKEEKKQVVAATRIQDIHRGNSTRQALVEINKGEA